MNISQEYRKAGKWSDVRRKIKRRERKRNQSERENKIKYERPGEESGECKLGAYKSVFKYNQYINVYFHIQFHKGEKSTE